MNSKNVIDLRFYAPGGQMIGETSYFSEMTTADTVKQQLQDMNKEGRMPAVGGPMSGYVTFDIISKRKDANGLIVLSTR